jgi:hypothetical protein
MVSQLQNIRRRKCDNLGVQKQHKPKVQHFLIELVPSLPSDLVMGFGGRWQFQMLQNSFNSMGTALSATSVVVLISVGM